MLAMLPAVKRCFMNFWVGIALTIVAAIMNGNFAVPLKRTRQWSWENSWALYSLVAFLVIPWGLAGFTNPHLLETFNSLSSSQILTPLLFGMGWGISQVLLGVSVARVGMALTFAIVIGLSASLGTLIPLLTLNPRLFLTGKGVLVLIGIAIMVGGIYLCAKAGKERERMQAVSTTHSPNEGSANSGYGTALAITIIAGVLTPMLNYALAFGKPVLQRAVDLGSSPANATYAVWVIALLGGLPVNLLYCAYLLNRNRTWSAFGARTYDGLRAMLMGVLWMGSIAVYGVGTTYLGYSGAAIGWGLFSIFVILAANVSGLITGEWRGVGSRPLRNLSQGLVLLTVASVAIAWGNR
jgi:L-rhamnose-H+ transport protein